MFPTDDPSVSLINNHWKFYDTRLLQGSAKIHWHVEGEKAWFRVPFKSEHLYIELPLPIPSGEKRWKGKYLYPCPAEKLTTARQYNKIDFTLSANGWQGIPRGFARIKVWTIKML